MPDRALNSPFAALLAAQRRAHDESGATPRFIAGNVIAITARAWGLHVSPSCPGPIFTGAERPLTVFPGHWPIGVMSRSDRALHLAVALSVGALALLGSAGPWHRWF